MTETGRDKGGLHREREREREMDTDKWCYARGENDGE